MQLIVKQILHVSQTPRTRGVETGEEVVFESVLVARGLVMWKQITETLKGPSGSKFFSASMRGTEFPGGARSLRFISGWVTKVVSAPSEAMVEVAVHPGGPPEVRLANGYVRELWLRPSRRLRHQYTRTLAGR